MDSISRRRLIQTAFSAVALPGAAQTGPPVDRARLVRRHNPVSRVLDPLAPLSVGNGEFAFTVDITGLQTFPERYLSGTPLCTQSQWGWHTAPMPAGLSASKLKLTLFDAHGPQVPYASSNKGQEPLFNWLRENPHRLNLARIGFRFMEGGVDDLKEVEQTLDLWTGIITSRFVLNKQPVVVRTCCHPDVEMVAVDVSSPLLANQAITVLIEFPYGSPNMDASDWKSVNAHESKLARPGSRHVEIERVLDKDRYFFDIDWDNGALVQDGRHRFLLSAANGSKSLSFRFALTPLKASKLADSKAAFEASAKHWPEFWNSGAAMDLSESADKRAPELERRVVLSQYLTAIQCAGSIPPQESGLTCNSWYGKFHLEMHWWHAVHFGYWGRIPLLDRSLNWYRAILPMARANAKEQGYQGARWPKMVGPEGRDSPSPVGPFLIWQQPHPIFYAELIYRARPTRQTLERFRDIVFESAEFMASYAWFDRQSNRYVLGPPLIPAQENHAPTDTWNPTYELEYWRWGLEVAQKWKDRLREKRDSKWDDVRAKLSPLPTAGGVYLAHENCPETFTAKNVDHPSMLAALGVLPGDGVDRETMRGTLKTVMARWDWPKAWGWDFPMTAMTAARLGEPEIALDALMMESPKNRYLLNGHNYQRPNLPLYLPGNGGVLAAVAMMAPNFPAKGWKARWEKLEMPL